MGKRCAPIAGRNICIKVQKNTIKPTRLLVVAPNWIGDALMAQPLLARLREKHPGCAIDVVAPPWVAPVARRMPEVSAVIEADLRHGELQLGEQIGRAHV